MAMTLLTTNPSSGAASSSFTSSIDSTYKLYIFKIFDFNPVTDSAELLFNGSDDTSSHSYDIAKTTTFFTQYHDEADSDIALEYVTNNDLADSTDFAQIGSNTGNLADESAAGTLWLFNPSNTTYVKHFYSTVSNLHGGGYAQGLFVAGYFNTTAAITAVQFKANNGNHDSIIKMYGVG